MYDKPLKWYKQKAKEAFQLYVRLRDADKKGLCRCCTCHTIVHYKECDGGHFIRAHNMAVCFDERNVHAQCKQCNYYAGGQWERYIIFMQNKYGQKVIDELNTFRGVTVRRSKADYMYIIQTNRKKIKALQEEKGL